MNLNTKMLGQTETFAADQPLLVVDDIKKHFPVKVGFFQRGFGQVKAVDGVSFHINEGETFGLVGESGCGKSTVGRLITRLYKPSSGKIEFAGQDITHLEEKKLNRFRRDMQMIFQDPYSSLNPRKTVGHIIGQPYSVHNMYTRKGRLEKVDELLYQVGLSPQVRQRYPHEFSGGQRQRIGIARALALNPKLIIADEPVSALDVSVQAQVLNLLQDLQEEKNLTYLFISHDLGVVKHICDRVGVMYLGNMVETAVKDDLYAEPLHPYTQALLSSIPRSNPNDEKERIVLQGDMPDPSNPPGGCVFHTRCPYVMDHCKTEVPLMKEVKNNHRVACHLYEAD